MSDVLAPVFTDRATRLSGFSEEQRKQFEVAATASKDPDFIDRHLASVWISQRTGLPHDEVVKNFDGLAKMYFGEGATARTAYDSISGLYKRKGKSSSSSDGKGPQMQPDNPLSVSGSVIAKDMAGSLPAGASQMGYDTLGGLYANLANATGVRLQRATDFGEYNALRIERDRLRGIGDDSIQTQIGRNTAGGPMQTFGITTKTAEDYRLMYGADRTALPKRLVDIDAQMKAMEDKVHAENMAALDKAEGTFKKEYSDSARNLANTMYGLSRESPQAFGVRQEFSDTTVGSLTRTVGSLPVTALFGFLGPALGGGATYTSIYGQTEQERMAFEGDSYDPQRAAFMNMASAGPQAVMEYAFGMEKLMGKVLKETPKIGGKLVFGDAMKLMMRRGLESGLEEGVTEPLQNFWNDYMAHLSYDEKRQVFTADAFKQRAVESLSAFAMGALFGGAVSGLDIADRNRGVVKAERHLLTRDGQPFTAPDFAALRVAKTDEQIKAMAPDATMAELYLKAANGDQEAQANYQQETLKRAFVETAGMSVDGVTIGKVGDQIALQHEDGTTVLIDPNDKEAAALLREVQGEAIARNEATDETISQMQQKFGDKLNVERMQAQSISVLREQGVITAEQEGDALAAAEAINQAINPQDKNAVVMGISSLTQDEKTGALQMAAKIAQGAEPTVVVEEVAESWYKKAIRDGGLNPAELTAEREKWHQQEGEADPVANGKVTAQRADIEWFSKRVIDYALAKRKTELPGGWGKWLRALGERLKAILKGAMHMKKLLRDGKISPELESWFKQALGTDTQQQQHNAKQAELEKVFSQLPPEEQRIAKDAEQKLSDFEKLKTEYRQQEALQLQEKKNIDRAQERAVAQGLEERQRAMDFARAQAELAIEQAIEIPSRVKLSAQAQAMLEDWTFSLSQSSDQADAARFAEINKRHLEILNDAVANKTPIDTPEYQALAKEREVIKSRHNGMPPGKFAADHSFALTADNPAVVQQITGIPQTKGQQIQQKMQQLALKQRANFPYPYHQLAALPTQAKVSLDGHRAGWFGQALLPVSERLRFIADKLGTKTAILSRVRRYYFEKGELLKKFSDMTNPLMKGLTKMSAVDLREWAVAASNQDKLNRDRLTAKYGLQDAWMGYEAARDILRANMVNAGIEVGEIGEYFPRWVKDVTGLRASLGITADYGELTQAVIDAEKSMGRELTTEEVNAVLDGAARGVQYGAKGVSKPANTKARKIQTIQPGQWEFYADPNHALSRWLTQSTDAIARYRFFGKNVVIGPSAKQISPTQIDTDASIGAILREEVDAGNLSPTAQNEVKSILDGLFSSHGQTNAMIRGIMDLTYWATMGKLSSGMAQAVDVMNSVYEAGPWNTAMSVPEALWRNAKNLPGIGNVKSWSEAVAKFTSGGPDWLTREQMGVDRILDEFNDQRFTARALNQVFTAVGLNFMDGIGKDVTINAKTRQLEQQAKRGNLSARNLQMIEGIFGKQKAQEVIKDFAAGNQTSDTIFTAYNVLADWQPINLAEYPEFYAKNPNGRILYMLKSYSLKALASYRREGFMKMWYGNKSQKMEGARNITYLLALLWAAGASKDWLVDFMLDRDPQMDDIMVDNIFKLGQVSRYTLWQQRNRNTESDVYGFAKGAAQLGKNAKQILVDMVVPPFTLIERPAKDITAWAKAKENGDAFDVLSSESIQFIPGAGEFMYWSGPTGQATVERRRKLREANQ